MTLALNKYENLCTNNKCQVKSPKEQHIVALSAELQNMMGSNIKLGKVLQTKRYTRGKYPKEI